MVRNRVRKNGPKFLNGESIDGAQTIDQSLEIFHLLGALKNRGKLVARQPTVIEEHSINDRGVEEFACFGETFTIAIAQMVILQAERLAIDLVQDRQCHVQVLHASFHVLDARVDLRNLHLQLLKVLLYVPLLHPVLILDVIRKVFRHVFEGHLVLLLPKRIDALAVLAPGSFGLDRPHPNVLYHLALNICLLHHLVDLVAQLYLGHVILQLFFEGVSEVVRCRVLGLGSFHEFCCLREVIHVLLHTAPLYALVFLSFKVVDGQNTGHKSRIVG